MSAAVWDVDQKLVVEIERDQIRDLDDGDLQSLLAQTRRRLVMADDDPKPDWLLQWFEVRADMCSRELDWRLRAEKKGGPPVDRISWAQRTERIKVEKTIAEVVVASGVRLRHVGRVYKGLCPFHSEKTASFICWPSTGRWRCFGCSQGGDVLDYVQKWQGIDFKAALEFLEGRAA